MSSELASDSIFWYAIHTHAKQEDRAYSNLVAWKVESFSPKIREPYSHPYTGSLTYKVRPLFPRYIFARFDASRLLHKVWFTRGVHSVVSCGLAPLSIDDHTVNEIKSHVGNDGFIKLNDEIEPGDEVVVKDGPFMGLSGIFERETNDSERVVILLNTIGYQANVVVDRQLIRKNV